jgi:hypothetical protein
MQELESSSSEGDELALRIAKPNAESGKALPFNNKTSAIGSG